MLAGDSPHTKINIAIKGINIFKEEEMPLIKRISQTVRLGTKKHFCFSTIGLLVLYLICYLYGDIVSAGLYILLAIPNIALLLLDLNKPEDAHQFFGDYALYIVIDIAIVILIPSL